MERLPRINISEGQKDEVSQSWSYLKALSAIEELWDAVVQNYLEFESQQLSAALKDSMVLTGLYQDHNKSRREFSRSLSNLLHSCRGYINKSRQIKMGDPSSDHLYEFKKSFKEQYDNSFAYRLMEALRNFSQHRGEPVHSLTISSGWEGKGFADNENALLRISVAPKLDLEKLLSDPSFKAGIKGEISDKGRWLDLRLIVREYIQCLGCVHEAMRSHTKPSFDHSCKIVLKVLNDYDACLDKSRSLKVVSIYRESDDVKMETVFEDLTLYVTHLRSSNQTAKNLSKYFITNRVES